MAKPYNGHRSWNAWNVSLWINNDYGLYSWAVDLVNEHGRERAARLMLRRLSGTRTPDGANYNLTCIREALVGMD
jgi:hypothetical protein